MYPHIWLSLDLLCVEAGKPSILLGTTAYEVSLGYTVFSMTT